MRSAERRPALAALGLRPVFGVLAVLAVVGGCAAPVAPPPRPVEPPAPATVLGSVRAAPRIRALPADLVPALAAAARDVGFDSDRCEAGPADAAPEPCVFGDRASAFDVVLTGDSHAGMWLPALRDVAERRHWRLQFLGKPGCPVVDVAVRSSGACSRFREHLLGRVGSVRPELVVVTNASFYRRRDDGAAVTAREWRAGLARMLRRLHRPASGVPASGVPASGVPASGVAVLGDIPVLAESGPECLAAHPRAVAACATGRAAATAPVLLGAERAAARATGSMYLSVLPWMCGAVCTPVVGNVLVYRNRFHLTATYARMLAGVVEEALIRAFPAASRGDAAGIGLVVRPPRPAVTRGGGAG